MARSGLLHGLLYLMTQRKRIEKKSCGIWHEHAERAHARAVLSSFRISPFLFFGVSGHLIFTTAADRLFPHERLPRPSVCCIFQIVQAATSQQRVTRCIIAKRHILLLCLIIPLIAPLYNFVLKKKAWRKKIVHCCCVFQMNISQIKWGYRANGRGAWISDEQKEAKSTLR